MTKEECLKALNNLSRYANIGRAKHGAGGCVVDNFVSNNEAVIYNLICDNFDNPPLKFEEFKEGMWVWDDVEKEFLKVKCVCVADEGHYIFKEGTKIIEFVLCGISSRTVDVEFEPNRFYRKQVEE